MELVHAAKARVLAVIEGALPAREAAILVAVLFGDQKRLGKEEVEACRTLGAYQMQSVFSLPSQVDFPTLIFPAGFPVPPLET